jgi:signal transduction histidine kinase
MNSAPSKATEGWAAFVSRAGPIELRPLILDSWIRSGEAGVGRARDVLPPRISDAELEARCKASESFLQIAARHLRWLSAHLSASKHVAYVTDADGIVLHSEGDAAMRRDFGLDPGHDWSEQAMGTNGAGTAIASGQPVAVVGAEHYLMAFGDCTCTAAPIYSDGRLVGALDVSSAARDATPDRLVLVAHIAAVIEHELQHAKAISREGAYQRLIEQLDAAQKETTGTNELFKVVTDGLPVLVSYVDERQCYRLANDMYVRWFGENPAGRHVSEVLGERAYAATRSHIEAALRGEAQRFEATIEYRLIGSRDIVATYIPDRRSDRIAGFVALVQDVTETNRLRRALEAAVQRRDEFVAILGHELRNPLSAIRNGLQILERAPGNAEVVGTVTGIIRRQLTHVQRLLDDLMDLERISRGKIELRLQRVALAEALRAAVESNQQMIEGKSHDLIVEIEDETLEVEGDMDRLLQAVGNLLSNAAKYTDKGGKIWLSLKRSGNMSLVSIRDTGIGIPRDSLAEIFEMFYQVKQRQPRAGGLGIGLALTRQIVELHGGMIEARSEGPGRGSEFRVLIPLAISEG